jgi:O-antigen/teichoic acid export membrane protein
VIIIPVLVLGSVGSELFSFVFGDIWRDAGVYAQIMSVAVGTKFVVSPLSTIMYVSGNIKLGSKWKTIYFISSYVTLFIAGHFTVINFVVIYTFHEIALFLLYYYFICKASNSLS